MTKKQLIILLILSLVIAIMFLFVPASFLAIVYFRLIAIGFILLGIIKLTFLTRYQAKIEFIFDLIEGILAIVFGVIYIHYYNYLTIDIICFIVLLILPVLRLVYAEKKLNQLGFDFLKYIGLVSMLFGYSAASKPFFIFCGALWFMIAIVLLILYLKGVKHGEEN